MPSPHSFSYKTRAWAKAAKDWVCVGCRAAVALVRDAKLIARIAPSFTCLLEVGDRALGLPLHRHALEERVAGGVAAAHVAELAGSAEQLESSSAVAIDACSLTVLQAQAVAAQGGLPLAMVPDERLRSAAFGEAQVASLREEIVGEVGILGYSDAVGEGGTPRGRRGSKSAPDDEN